MILNPDNDVVELVAKTPTSVDDFAWEKCY